MAPLDAGTVMNLRLVDPVQDLAAPSPGDYEAIGAYLRAVRLHQGLSLADLAEKTRIGRTYLQAIEETDLSSLPSRPFAIGYVRSYARALGVDGDAAAARYKTETPDFSEPLRNPVGVKHERPRRNPLVFVLVAVLLAGVVAWNVTQHRAVRQAGPAPTAVLSAAQPPAPHGPIALGAATPPPADQTMPAPYVTPGMDPAGAAPGQTSQVQPAAATPVAAVAPHQAPPVFTPKGAVYGAPAGVSAMTLQANKAASLIIRGPGGAVYFARQLSPGEAYRAPFGSSLVADIADAAAFDVYVNGQSAAPLPQGLTPLDRLTPHPVAPSAPTTSGGAPSAASSVSSPDAALDPGDAPAPRSSQTAPPQSVQAPGPQTPAAPPQMATPQGRGG